MFNITNIPEVKVYKIADNTAIVDVQYNTRYELCSAFMRVQEFYESDIPSIKDNYFTIEKFMDEYAKKNGGFSYTMDWSGFNIPSNAYFNWYGLYRNNLLEKEKALDCRIIAGLHNAGFDSMNNDLKFYIIGSYKECPRQAAVIQHEIAHALYSLDEEYKYHSDLTCAVLPFRDDIIAVLKEWGYSDSVIKDEVQAYARTNCKGDWEHFPKVDTDNTEFKELVESLQVVFKMACRKYGIVYPEMPTDEVRIKLEEEYKKKYGYNAGEMI